MPPDIVRPIASTTMGCLVTIIHRMGMIWSDINLDEGKFRATGYNRSFSASVVRGMGLVVEYSSERFSSVVNSTQEFRVPSILADMVGIISAY